MATKDEEAIKLAEKHYEIEWGLTRVIRVQESPDVNIDPNGKIILLEVNTNTLSAGMMPLQFGPVPSAGFHYPSVIMEVTPDEFEQIQKSR